MDDTSINNSNASDVATTTVLQSNGWNKEGLKEFRDSYNAVIESRKLHGQMFDSQFMERMAQQAASQPKKRQRVSKEYAEELPNDLGTEVFPV